MICFDDGTLDGAVSANGRIAGCHVHGLFAASAFRSAFVAALGARPSHADYADSIDIALDEIATTLQSALRIDAIESIARAEAAQ
jgi:adenosylcobyric acid synthase